MTGDKARAPALDGRRSGAAVQLRLPILAHHLKLRGTK